MTDKKNVPLEAESVRVRPEADPTGLLARCVHHINAVSRMPDPASARGWTRRGGSHKNVLEHVRLQVENHFRRYREEAAACDSILEEFAEAYNTPEVVVQTGPADPTLDSVVHAEEAFRALFGWREVVRHTFRKFKGTPVEDVLHVRFDLGLSSPKAQDQICMSSSSFYAHLNSAMHYASLVAAQRNLLDLD